MKKYLLLLLLFCLLTGCAPENTEAQVIFSAMDTPMTITAYGKSAQDAVRSAQAEIFRLDALLSRTNPHSDITRLNEAAGAPTPVPVSHETALLLAQSKACAPEFDVTIAPVMDAWGFGREDSKEAAPDAPGRQVPEASELERLLTLVDFSKLEVDTENNSARLSLPGMEADLGGIGKGYAGDRAAQVLKENGVTSAILNLGGNITALGARPDGTPWKVGVTDPKNKENYFCVLSLMDKTAATSGGYQRYFVQDGATYHHILDPQTGYPAQSGLLSATVVAPTSAEADLLSTYCFLLGPDRALDYWRSRDDVDLVLVTEDGRVLVTEGLEAGIAFTEEGSGYPHEIVRR